ncbi:hypothetical protein A1O3_02079 [Capronia epimyces CBS 606.96]|uniref:Glycosyltransferase 2-like domain-containing protein n=1 Tax=Capronia epimyces CBS 606.96 TaxID=1182542 RepID=W9YH80_9EURO|nr:uncharacterized protein A1O3_02079 [Capronia epimyces CBS 606.96]EXJ89015.1 hypothetical protein A1O3_02079 [Capronia epimyces CBS 606.96]
MAEPVSVDGHLDVTSVTQTAPAAVVQVVNQQAVNQHAVNQQAVNQQAVVPYNIITVEKKPAVPTSYISSTLTAVSLANTTAYVIALIVHLVNATSLGQKNLLPAQLFAAAQVFENCSTITETLWRLTIGFIRNPVPRPTYRILGDFVPGVDLIIVACGEPNDIVLDTVKAACQVDWPVAKLRIVLADDGDDEELREDVKDLRKQHPNLHYFARYKPHGVHHGYKAGNLNATLAYIDTLPGGQHEFMAVLDADMIPESCILRALVPHALQADNVGMVTTAQHFYNIPNNDPLYQSNVTGTGADDGVRDSVGAAWCPGSGFVLRTAAWISMGKFPEFTITEDLMTSWFLHGHGWQISLCHEILQWGLQPDCLLTHLKQRRRWWTGHVRDAFRTNFSIRDKRLEQATWIQRVAMFHHCCRPYFNTVFKALSLFLVAMALFLRGPVIATPTPTTLRMMMMSVFFARILGRISEFRAAQSISLWNLRRRQATNTWLGIHFARDVFFSALPRGIGGLRLGFDVTGVSDTHQPVKERDAVHRPRMLTRLWILHKREGILYHAVLVVIMTFLIIRAIRYEVVKATVDGQVILDKVFWDRLLSGAGYPGLSLIELVPLFLTPVIYVMFPPTMPPRRERMLFNEDTGLWRAKTECKGIKWTKESFWLEIPHFMGAVWMVVSYMILRHFSMTDD